MKTLFRISVSVIILITITVFAFSQNNVGIGTTTPAAVLDVQGNGVSYDVLRVSNNSGLVTDRMMVFTNQGNLGIGVNNPGIYKLLAHGSPSVFSPQVEVWQGDPYTPGSFMLADLNDVGAPPFNGALNLYLNGNRNVSILASGNSYLNGGNVGIGIGTGITPPNEILHLGGAMVLGQSTAPVPVPGTIHFNPGAGGFFGYDGVNWNSLDQNIFWTNNIGIGGQPTLYNNFPGPVAISIPGYVPTIAAAHHAYLYANNSMPPAPFVFGHQLLLDDVWGNYNASQGFLITNWQSSGINQQYSMGIYNPDASFKITKSGALASTLYSDGLTMTRFNQNGIVDLPNQSRVRAYQENLGGMTKQLIPPNTWTPVNFNIKLPPAHGYDEHNEFNLAPGINTPVPPELAFFAALQDGYYQVNARCEFDVDEYFEDDLGQTMPVQVTPDSYVSIAIYTGLAPGQTSIYAQGNNLQIGYSYTREHAMLITIPNPDPSQPPFYELIYENWEEIRKIENNNAPNVSDVVFLKAGEIISIWVYHTALTPMNLNYMDKTTNQPAGKSKIYVSIHKVS